MSSLTITVLFTDLVGSTELLSKVGEARSEELRREVFSICRQAASSHEGREVKNLGDGLMLVFPAPSAGLETAVAIQQLLERRNRHSQEDLLLRIGISTGEVEEEDGDYFGRPVVEAARLCAKARGGEILATEIVKHLAGSRFTHEITSLGPLELKGLEEPVRAISVHWLPLEEPGEPRIPLPRRLRRSPSATFVGRSQELEIIEQKLKAAISEEGRQVILVAGEPGIGKTTLVSQAAAKALERGASVTYGRCDQDLALPYQPFAEALGYLLDNLDTLEIRPEEELHRSVGSLAPLMGGANREDAQAHASGPDAAAERSVLFGAVAGFLEKASRRSGLLLILDDLQWADDPSLSLLGYLCRHSRESKLAILGTFRDAEVGSDHPFSETLVALHREPDVTRISLAGLSDSDTLEMMEAIAGHDLGQEGLLLRDALLSETRGNPFFLEEMLRHLAESGALVRHEGRWVAVFDPEHFSLPVSLKEVLGRRVANLGPRTKQTLSVASILGQEFDLELLSGVSGSSLEECLSHCEAATRVPTVDFTRSYNDLW